MKTLNLEPFKAIGIKVRTSNENEQAAQDIGALWQRFMSEDIRSKIPNKVDDSILSIYTNYEGDHSKPYDTVLACKVSSDQEIPEGMVSVTVEGGSYAQFETKGDCTKGVVYQAWLDIWKKGLNRTHASDFEVYDERAMDPTNATVDIFVGLKS